MARTALPEIESKEKTPMFNNLFLESREDVGYP